MERFFRFNENTSDKFWEIEFTDNSYTVFFGRIGSAGRVETKLFSNNSDCSKEVDNQIKSKMKKGYIEVSNSNRPIKDADTLSNIIEFEEQWDLKVSPISKRLMNQTFFWSCIEETSPFGSDQGSDMFSFFQQALQKNPRTRALDFLSNVLEGSPLTDLTLTESEEIISNIGKDEDELEEDLEEIIRQDSSIWAVSFGQLVIRGNMDEELKQIALHSLERQKSEIFLELHGDKNRVEHIELMENVLNNL